MRWFAVSAALLLAACELPPPAGVSPLTQAESVETGMDDVLPPDARWRSTPLPDNWDGTRHGYEGFVRYRLQVDWQPDDPQRMGLYLPALGMNAYPVVNGTPLGRVGRMAPPVTRHFYTPLLWEVPRELLRPGANRIEIVVVGHAGYRCGLAAPLWGEHARLHAAWRLRGWVQNTGTLVMSTLVGALGLYVLLLWLRERDNQVFGWFGLAAVVWALRNLNYVVTDAPWSPFLWSQMTVSGAAVFQALFALFTLRYCESVDPADRAPRWLAPGLLVYAAAACVWFLSARDFATARLGFVPFASLGLAITAWGQWRLIELAARVRSAETIAIAVSGFVYMVLVLHDFMIGRDVTRVGGIYLRQYASVPLFLSIGWMLTRRYFDALEQARSASASLRTQVEAQRQQLERYYGQLRRADQEQARGAERERVMRELHDGLGLHLITAYEQCQRGDVDTRVIGESLQDCLTDLRVAIDSLAPDERDPLAVLGTLRFRMAPRLEAVGMALRWEVEGEVPELSGLDPARTLHLLRIVQEALTNALRHSGARSVTLRVEGQPQAVTVVVRDDGRGFDAASGRSAAQRGLANMRERARHLGGQFEIRSGAHGTELRIVLPVDGSDAQATLQAAR